MTAWINAFVRAYHTLHDPEPIFADPVARRLFTDDEFASIAAGMAASLEFFDAEAFAARTSVDEAVRRVLREHSAPIVLSRARYAEESLLDAVRAGATQYLVLGAGMDTWAFRRPAAASRVEVFELDHPATQGLKKERLDALGGAPPHLHLVPLDFAADSPARALSRTPFDPQAATFVSWLGVTYYLELPAIRETLRTLATLVPPNSALVFDFLEPEAFTPQAPARVQRMIEIVRRIGEPMKTAFEPAELRTELEQTGWLLAESLDPPEIQRRYFAGCDAGYRAFEDVHFARAVTRAAPGS
jgi:methyltransferase (TIGR00027 family)